MYGSVRMKTKGGKNEERMELAELQRWGQLGFCCEGGGVQWLPEEIPQTFRHTIVTSAHFSMFTVFRALTQWTLIQLIKHLTGAKKADQYNCAMVLWLDSGWQTYSAHINLPQIAFCAKTMNLYSCMHATTDGRKLPWTLLISKNAA